MYYLFCFASRRLDETVARRGKSLSISGLLETHLANVLCCMGVGDKGIWWL